MHFISLWSPKDRKICETYANISIEGNNKMLNIHTFKIPLIMFQNMYKSF